MRVFGWIYLILFSINAVFSLLGAISTESAGIQLINGALSIVIIILSILVFIFSCMGKLMPRKVFLTLPIYYFLTAVFGIIVSVLLVMKIGAEKIASAGATPELLSETFAWFNPANWAINIVFIVLAVFGIIKFLKKTETNA